MTQCYAVVYMDNGNFIIAEKLKKGYYFAGNPPAIVPSGQNLNGGGKVAFPGGKIEKGEATLGAAIREFLEETGVPLSADIPHKIKEWSQFHAVYFLLDEKAAVRTQQDSELALKNSLKIADAIKDKKITAYSGIAKWATENQATPWPADNELAAVHFLNVKTDWTKIETWKTDKELDWYYDIARYLKDDILKI